MAVSQKPKVDNIVEKSTRCRKIKDQEHRMRERQKPENSIEYYTTTGQGVIERTMKTGR
jgi:hypothetical protein